MNKSTVTLVIFFSLLYFLLCGILVYEKIKISGIVKLFSIKSIFNIYKEKYHISTIDLADSGETNRIHMLISSFVLFLFGFICSTSLFFINIKNLQQHIISLIYFSIFTVSGLAAFLYSKNVKDVSREKAYKWKTASFYVLFFIYQFEALYNFFFLNQPFNGFLVSCLTSIISLCLFSFSPFPFVIVLFVVVGIMSPSLYNNFRITGLVDCYMTVILMFCLSLYKRRAEKKYILMISKQKSKLEAKTFGNFTLMYENKIIKFSRTKTNELMGYLVYKKGSSVRTKELITILWGEHADSARYGNSLRNLIVDVKHSLAELDIQNFFIAEYNNFRINPDIIQCDYYDFLAGDKKAINSFAGEFMSQYSWAEDVAGFLEKKVLK